MKLYNNISRFLVRRQVHRRAEKKMHWLNTLKPGDLINDCTSFNVELISFKPEVFHINDGWYIYDYYITVGPYGGSCSLMSCGVEPPKSREVLENDYLSRTQSWLDYPGEGGAAHWYSGLDNPKYAKELQRINNRLDVLKSGGHILDARGVLLTEFQRS